MRGVPGPARPAANGLLNRRAPGRATGASLLACGQADRNEQTGGVESFACRGDEA